jgi:hypothetical protein
MASIVPFLRSHVFDEETTKAMEIAFDEACKNFQDQPHLFKEIMAKRIVEAAKYGERDPHRLCAKALNALGNLRYFP